MEEKFTFFWSGPFSQWHPSPFVRESVWYSHAEQYMMAEKAMMFGDIEAHRRIMGAADPADQKRYGREVKNFIKKEWDEVARDIVFRGNYAKFTQNTELKEILLKTAGTTLVEASPHDKIWGIGLRKNNPRAYKRETWLGTNWLGETLTKVREAIIKDGA